MTPFLPALTEATWSGKPATTFFTALSMAPLSETTFRPLSFTISAGDFVGSASMAEKTSLACLPLICPESIKLISSRTCSGVTLNVGGTLALNEVRNEIGVRDFLHDYPRAARSHFGHDFG